MAATFHEDFYRQRSHTLVTDRLPWYMYTLDSCIYLWIFFFFSLQTESRGAKAKGEAEKRRRRRENDDHPGWRDQRENKKEEMIILFSRIVFLLFLFLYHWIHLSIYLYLTRSWEDEKCVLFWLSQLSRVISIITLILLIPGKKIRSVPSSVLHFSCPI